MKRILWNGNRLLWSGDLLLWGDERVAATVRHATEGGGNLERRVAVTLQHATQGAGAVAVGVEKRVAVTLRHALRGAADDPVSTTDAIPDLDVGVEKRVAAVLRHATQGAGELGGERRVVVTLQHATQGAGQALERQHRAVAVTLQHATQGAGAVYVGVEKRVAVVLRHALRGPEDDPVSVTDAVPDIDVGVEKRVVVTLQHATQGGGQVVERQHRGVAAFLRHALEGAGGVRVFQDRAVRVRLRHALQGRGGLTADEIIIGGIGLFDPRVAGGWPEVRDNPTPGVLIRASRGATATRRDLVVDGRLAGRRMGYGLSRIYTTGPAYVVRLGMSVSAGTTTVALYLDASASGSGASAGPGLSDVALSRLGVAFRVGDLVHALDLGVLAASDGSEPYLWRRAATAADAAMAAALQGGGAAEAVIVDRFHNNIHWTALEVGATRQFETSGEGDWQVYLGLEDETRYLRDVSIRGTVNNRGEATVDLAYRPGEVTWPGGVPVSGEDVTIFWRETTAPGHVVRRFGGRVVNPSAKLTAAAERVDARVPAVSYAARLDQLLIREFHRTRPEHTVPEAVARVVQNWAAGEGFETFGVQSSNLAGSHVWDHVPVADALTALAEQIGGFWCVDPFKVIVLRATDDAPLYPHAALTAGTFASVSRKVDEQLLRTAQLVVGGAPQSGQRRQEREGDGVRREFQLDYRPERVITVAVDGTAQSFSTNAADGAQWTINLEAGTVSQRPGDPVLAPGRILDVIYDYNFPIVRARENSAAVLRYGRIWAVEQDASLDTVEAADDLLNRRLTSHEHPTVVVTGAGALGTRAVGLAEGLRVPLEVPAFGLAGETWLCDSVEWRRGAAGVREVSAEFQRSSHEALFEAPIKRRRRLTTPTQPLSGARVLTAGGGEINPDALAREGLKLPAPLAGSPTSVNRNEDWEDIEGGALTPLDGDNLPSSIVRWAATASVRGGSTRGFVRLWNRTRGVAVGPVVEVSSTAPVPISAGRITLSAGLGTYVLQCRKTGGGRFDGVRVWGAVIEVGA